MTWEFHSEALREHDEAAAWYEEQRYLLGTEFSGELEAGLSAILADPGQFQPLRENLRVFRLKRFPYRVLFRWDKAAAHIQILAIVHKRRHPDYWRERL